MNGSIADVLASFPMPLMAGMMLLVSIQLAQPIIELRGWKLGPAFFTAVLSVIATMALGFIAGLAALHLLRGSGRHHSLFSASGKKEDDEPHG